MQVLMRGTLTKGREGRGKKTAEMGECVAAPGCTPLTGSPAFLWHNADEPVWSSISALGHLKENNPNKLKQLFSLSSWCPFIHSDYFFFCCRHFWLFLNEIDFDRACLLLLRVPLEIQKREPFPKLMTQLNEIICATWLEQPKANTIKKCASSRR